MKKIGGVWDTLERAQSVSVLVASLVREFDARVLFFDKIVEDIRCHVEDGGFVPRHVRCVLVLDVDRCGTGTEGDRHDCGRRHDGRFQLEPLRQPADLLGQVLNDLRGLVGSLLEPRQPIFGRLR